MLKEFRDFAMRGNVVDLAVGVIIGAAFGKITSSLVADVMMPPIGMLLGKVDFSNLFVVLGPGDFASLSAARDAGAPVIAYGSFINSIIDFVIVAFAIFIVVKQMNRLKALTDKPAPVAAPTERACPECLSMVPIAAKRCKFCASALPPA
ncbi:MAG: large conductance mechanosensitive channel protein MscL [Rhodospirillaceae bacterium]|nr:large conductance mechanosensitive channel protein MscL [Rhodospirillaceae bacterium]